MLDEVCEWWPDPGRVSWCRGTACSHPACWERVRKCMQGLSDCDLTSDSTISVDDHASISPPHLSEINLNWWIFGHESAPAKRLPPLFTQHRRQRDTPRSTHRTERARPAPAPASRYDPFVLAMRYVWVPGTGNRSRTKRCPSKRPNCATPWLRLAPASMGERRLKTRGTPSVLNEGLALLKQQLLLHPEDNKLAKLPSQPARQVTFRGVVGVKKVEAVTLAEIEPVSSARTSLSSLPSPICHLDEEEDANYASYHDQRAKQIRKRQEEPLTMTIVNLDARENAPIDFSRLPDWQLLAGYHAMQLSKPAFRLTPFKLERLSRSSRRRSRLSHSRADVSLGNVCSIYDSDRDFSDEASLLVEPQSDCFTSTVYDSSTGNSTPTPRQLTFLTSGTHDSMFSLRCRERPKSRPIEPTFQTKTAHALHDYRHRALRLSAGSKCSYRQLLPNDISRSPTPTQCIKPIEKPQSATKQRILAKSAMGFEATEASRKRMPDPPPPSPMLSARSYWA